MSTPRLPGWLPVRALAVLLILVGAAGLAARAGSCLDRETTSSSTATDSTATGTAAPLERTWTLPLTASLALEVDAGDVVVVPRPDRTVRVTVRVHGQAAEAGGLEWVDDASPDRLRIAIRQPEAKGFFQRLFGNHVRISGSTSGISEVRAEVPAEAEVQVSTGQGDVRVSGFSAPWRVETGAGDVTIEDAGGELAVETGAGDVRVARAAGDVRVETGAGDVLIDDTAGRVEVETGAGDVSVNGGPAGVRVESGAGSVRMDLHELRGDLEAETGMGSITVRLPSGSGFRLHAASGLGDVRLEAGDKRLSSEAIGSELTVTVGDGGPRVRLESGAGSITVTTPEGVRVE